MIPIQLIEGMSRCHKQDVVAVIKALSGRIYTGRNGVRRPQGFCPRQGMPSFTGYEYCREVCGQYGHAETVALEAAGDDAEGATLYLFGHVKCCPDCTRACDAAGIARVVVVD